MNVIILTGSCGMGHVKASEAIKEELLLKNKNINVKIIDFWQFLFPKLSNFIYAFFNFMVNKCSGIYNFFNKITNRFCGVPMKKLVFKKLDRLFKETSCDLVISTFPMCSQCISLYKEQKNKSVILYTYITDVVSHEEWICKNTDLYFVSASRTKNILESNGVASDKIIVSGIPVMNSFKSSYKKKICKNKKEILVMGGGLGIIPHSQELLNKLSCNSNYHITIITGKNTKLKNNIQKKYPDILVIGYINNVAKYLKKADLIITKSGGITTFEAINAGTPLYILKPFLIQEVGNAEFIEQNNIGKVIWIKKENILKNLDNLLNNHGLLDTMQKNMENLRNSFEDSCPLSYYEKRY